MILADGAVTVFPQKGDRSFCGLSVDFAICFSRAIMFCMVLAATLYGVVLVGCALSGVGS